MIAIVSTPPLTALPFQASTEEATPLPEQTLTQQLGRTIRTLRKAQGLSLVRVSERTGVSIGFISGIELGKHSPSLDTLHRLATGLGTTMATLLEGIGPGTQSNARGAIPRP